MPSASGNTSATIMGRAFSQSITVTGDNGGTSEPTVAAAKTGALTTRTSDSVGTITGQASHGVVDADFIDLYWDGGQRRHCLVGTVASLSIPITGGTGDVLPADETALTLMVENEETHVFTGDDILGFGVSSPNYAGTVVFRQSGGTEIFAVELAAGESYVWTEETGVTNPLAGGSIGMITFTHASAASSSPMYAAWVRD